jgi:hypothetical protein
MCACVYRFLCVCMNSCICVCADACLYQQSRPLNMPDSYAERPVAGGHGLEGGGGRDDVIVR